MFINRNMDEAPKDRTILVHDEEFGWCEVTWGDPWTKEAWCTAFQNHEGTFTADKPTGWLDLPES